jgi:hypothetical protein
MVVKKTHAMTRESFEKSESSLSPAKIAKWLGSSSHDLVTRPTTTGSWPGSVEQDKVAKFCCLSLGQPKQPIQRLAVYSISLWKTCLVQQSPVFLSLLCALCSCFVLYAHALCSVLMPCDYQVFWSPLAKHEARYSGGSSHRLESRKLNPFLDFGGRARRLELFVKGSSLFRARFSPK